MDKYKTKMTINKWFSLIKLENLSSSSQKSIQDFNRYAKKLTFIKVLKLFLFAINEETESLRHLDQQLVHPKLKKAIKVDTVSYSQLSRALKALDTSVLLEIFNQLLERVHQKTHISSQRKIYLVDSSTFSFSKASYPWANFRPTKSGIKLHLKVCLMDEGMVHPEQFEISHASEHDHDYLDVFVNEPHATYVFDRGYIDFESFDQMKWNGYFFVSRIKKNTVVHVVDDLDVPKDTDSDILSDQYVLLGGNGYLTSLMCLVTIRRKGRSDLRIITNDVFKAAKEIGTLYHSLWQIELFFKHIKQHMTIKNYYSKAEVGVEN